MNILKPVLLSLFVLSMLQLPAAVAAEDANQAAKIEVREHVLAFNKAYEKNDLDTYFGYYQAGATMWFNTDFVLIADYESDWRKMIAAGGGVQLSKVSDLRITMGPNNTSAVASYQGDVQTRMPDGIITNDASQESDTWFKTDGKWRIAHLHYVSQPIEQAASE